MKICGIVAEYNPIHNGHVYHIRKAKELTGCDCVVVCMSGDFTQRGEPAIADKYTRTKMALMQGADAVVELPTVYATASADFFAMGAVSILDRLGCDYICFGSECGEMDVLNRELDIQTELENKYLSEIKEEIKNGKSYIKALGSVAQNHGYSSAELKSNDRLALCYLKAMHACNSSMIPVCVKRLHGEYLDKDVTSGSAMSIREYIKSANLSETKAEKYNELDAVMPKEAKDILLSPGKEYSPVFAEDFFDLYYARLLSESDLLTQYWDISENIAGRIRKRLHEATDAESLFDIVASGEYTRSRICRALTHCLLSIKTDDVNRYIDNGYVGYALLLGIRKDAEGIFARAKECERMVLIGKKADAKKNLAKVWQDMFDTDVNAALIYNHVLAKKKGVAPLHEMEHQIVCI